MQALAKNGGKGIFFRTILELRFISENLPINMSKITKGRWAGHDNKAWPRDLEAERFPVPIYPGDECDDKEWQDYNTAYDEYEEKVKERRKKLLKKPRYKNKKV